MLKLQINGKPYQAEREALEKKILSHLLSKKAEALGKMPNSGMITSTVKGAASMLLNMMGTKPPQNVDTLDFAIGLLVNTTFDALESQTLNLTLQEAPAEKKADDVK